MEHNGNCISGDCGWTYSSETAEMRCCNGDGCAAAHFLEAEISDFHDEALINATQTIKTAIAEALQYSEGRELALLNTGSGILLAWVTHDEAFASQNVESLDESYVTKNNSADAIKKALKLKPTAQAS